MSRRRRRNAYTIHNEARLIRGGADYFNLLEEVIDSAVSCIQLQIYILDEDETGRRIAAALMRAAKRGVDVYILADGYASQYLSRKFIIELRLAGAHFSYFEPFVRSRNFYFGRRLHCKVLVADAHKCLVAGINISNRYNDMDNSHPAWLDWAIYAEGQVAEQLHSICIKRWNSSVFRKKSRVSKQMASYPYPDKECLIRPRVNDWVGRKTEITKNYFELVRKSQSQLIIMSSYFWPSANLLKAIAHAAQRGVQVKLILAGISDVKTSKYAERYLYRALFKNKIEVYEYQDSVLHGKMAVCDYKQVTIGSYNVNNISAYASVELNMDVQNADFARQVHAAFDEIIANHCVQITEPVFVKQYNRLQRFLQYIAYRAVHLIFFLTTFYFRQRPLKAKSL